MQYYVDLEMKVALWTNLNITQRYCYDLSAIFENFEDSPSNLGALDVFRQDKIFLIVSNIALHSSHSGNPPLFKSGEAG